MGQPVALVAGGSGVLGAATVDALLARGYDVAVHHCSHRPTIDAQHNGSKTLVVQADVAVWDEVRAMEGEVRRELAPIDVLVNCAAVRMDGLMATQSLLDWQQSIAVNLMGAFHLCRATLPRMLQRRHGRIVNVVSTVATIGSPGQTAYSASKAGVMGLTRSLAVECASRNVTVNAISPGLFESPLTAGVDPSLKELVKLRSPSGAATDPHEIAKAIMFIIETPSMTGQLISLDGGIT
jgi:3-oxoacyl-[acyl-carrier protein] reductase